MNVLVLCGAVLVSLGAIQDAAPPPLSAAQRTEIGELARSAEQERDRIAGQLAQRQQALTELYAAYELDAEQAAKIEAEIVELQRERLASYRQMQVRLRAIVDEERFRTLKQRFDNLLQAPRRAERQANEAAAPGPSARPAERSAERPAQRENAPGIETPGAAVESPLSGPQVGEKLPPFLVRGVFDAAAGTEIDFVSQADGKPIVLVFVHEANRPSIGLTRTLTAYTASRAKDGLATGLVWLADDQTEAETTLKRMRHALAPDAPIGISIDGREGPGAYGLNRNVTLTILVANKNQVTANFALVQPSIQADLPKIFAAIVREIGGEAPSLEAAPGMPARGAAPARSAQAEPDPRLRSLLAPVIQLNASEDAVDRAALAVEEFVRANETAHAEVGRIARTIVGSGRVGSYGTPRAQMYLRKWAVAYGGLTESEAAGPEKQP